MLIFKQHRAMVVRCLFSCRHKKVTYKHCQLVNVIQLFYSRRDFYALAAKFQETFLK